MKKSFILLTSLVVSVGGAFIGCKPVEKPIDKNLPTIENLTLAPGEETTIEFYAYDAWTIAADKTWCEVDPQSGEKGDNTVSIQVEDAFAAEETAEVTLTIGQDKVTFNITRSSKERQITLKVNGTAVQSLEFSEETESYQIEVSANFQWELDENSVPAWIKISGLTAPESPDANGLFIDEEFTISINEDEIKNYYDSKTASITFSDVNSLDYSYTFQVSHTFEAPAGPVSVLSSQYGVNLTLGTDGKIKESNSTSIDFTLTPNEGESDFKAFLIAETFPMTSDAWSSYSYAPCNTAATAAAYPAGVWLSFTQKEGSTWTLTINNFPEKVSMGSYYTAKMLIFVLPSSVYNTFPADAQDPESSKLNRFITSNFVDNTTDNGKMVETTGAPLSNLVPYVITITLDKPAE